MLSTADVN